jgi:surface antigen
MRLAIVAGTAFVAALIGAAAGAALVVHPEWFGVSWTSAAPEAEAAERKRAADATRRAQEEARQREDEAAKPRTEVERKPPSTPPQRGQGVACDYAAPSLKGAFASEADCYFAQRNLTLALTTARDGAEPTTWTNPKSGASGTVRVFYTTRESDGTMCRRFEQTVAAKERKSVGVGTACFRSNAWQIAP